MLPDRQTLRGDSRHEDKHYKKIGNHGAQTSSARSRRHYSLRSKTSNDDKKTGKKGGFGYGFRKSHSLYHDFLQKKFKG